MSAPHPLAHPNPGGARPVDRIDDVLDTLRAYWVDNPDLRLGQIVCNLTPADIDVYFVEDAYLTHRLNEAAYGTVVPGSVSE